MKVLYQKVRYKLKCYESLNCTRFKDDIQYICWIRPNGKTGWYDTIFKTTMALFKEMSLVKQVYDL